MKLNKVIAVRTGKKVYEDGDTVVKVFDEDYSKSDVLNEALNQSRVEETGLAVPKILEVTKIDGKWAIVMEKIEGKTLQQMMDENPAKMDEYLNTFVDLQIEMHAKRSPLLNKLRDKMNRKINETSLDATIRYELQHRLAGMPRKEKLCHGDFNPSNIIVNSQGKMYIIDWSHATQGNASADAARTFLLFKLEGKEELAEQYLKLFCKKRDTARQYVNQWMPIVAASQSVKGKEKEREFLLKMIDVVDFE